MKKKMKKFWQICLVSFTLLCMVLPLVTVYAEETAKSNTTTIIFKLGDDILNINGTDVQVEKPYAVGAGVTLVPLRVITEAFGAQVDWENSTRTITLTYPDINIVLQIENPIAEVNKKAQTLLSAPEISGNYTMVPLRFISETFGATVSYDSQTGKITVVKSAQDTPSQTVISGFDNLYIGDSYWKWSMENPTGAALSYRSFDGMYTEFEYDENNYFYIEISIPDDDYDFERDFSSVKNTLKGYTLVAADKDTSNPKMKTMHLQAKDKNVLFDSYGFASEDYIISLVGKFEVSNEKIRSEALRLLATFKCSLPENSLYDLSNVEDGYREYKSENLGFSLKIPQNFYLTSSEDTENELSFVSADKNDYDSRIHFGVYSKSAVKSAKDLAELDRANNRKYYNQDLVKISEVSSGQYSNIACCEYEINVNAEKEKTICKDVFFEKGDYVYNVSVTVLKNASASDGILKTVLGSLNINQIDSDKIGILMRNDPETEGTYAVTIGDISFKIPSSFEEAGTSSSGKMFISNTSGAMISLTVEPSHDITLGDITTALKDVQSEKRKDLDCEVVDAVKSRSYGNNFFALLSYKEVDDYAVYYLMNIGGIVNKCVISLNAALTEERVTSAVLSEIDSILASASKK